MSNTVTGKIVATKYLGTSHYGNPYYAITLDNGETYRTMIDSSVNYCIENREFKNAFHTFNLTRAGRIRGYVPTH